jgi:heterodisulfide reductase subunit C
LLGLERCIACGRCASTCPVQAANPSFNPRRIVKLASMGAAHEVISSGAMWMCTGCHSCHERCPQQVHVTALMTALRNIAVRRGIVHPSFRAQVAELRRFGRLYEVGPFGKKRLKIALPALADDPGLVAGVFARGRIDEWIAP